MTSLRAFTAGVLLVVGMQITKGLGQNGAFNQGEQTGGATANSVNVPSTVVVPGQSPAFIFPSQSIPFFVPSQTQPQPTFVTQPEFEPVQEQAQPIVQSQPSQTDQVPVNNVNTNTNDISLSNENIGSNANQNNATAGATAQGFEGF